MHPHKLPVRIFIAPYWLAGCLFPASRHCLLPAGLTTGVPSHDGCPELVTYLVTALEGGEKRRNELILSDLSNSPLD